MSQYVTHQPARSGAHRRTSTRVAALPASVRDLFGSAVDRLRRVLVAHSIVVLRVSLGLVFLGFGVLKFYPGLSPAEAIASATLDRLTFGLVSGHAAVLLTAVTETVIGLTLVSGRFLRVGLVVLGGALIGIMSPLALFTAELFPHGPTLMGQYVLKDVVLAASALVVTAHALGARLHVGSDD